MAPRDLRKACRLWVAFSRTGWPFVPRAERPVLAHAAGVGHLIAGRDRIAETRAVAWYGANRAGAGRSAAGRIMVRSAADPASDTSGSCSAPVPVPDERDPRPGSAGRDCCYGRRDPPAGGMQPHQAHSGPRWPGRSAPDAAGAWGTSPTVMAGWLRWPLDPEWPRSVSGSVERLP